MLTLETVRIALGDFTLEAGFTVGTGAQVSVIGPSGAGKSTLLAAIGGFVAPASGRIAWNGTRIDRLAPGDRPVATIFQDGNLFPHLSAAQNVGLGLRPSGRQSAGERDRVAEALDRVGLAGFGARKPGALSGGEQGRVALARMLLQERPLVLLDEPFAALGPALRAGMIDLVRDLTDDQGQTLMMITHDPEDARRLGGQAVAVTNGRAQPPVETGDLLADPPPALRRYLGLP